MDGRRIYTGLRVVAWLFFTPEMARMRTLNGYDNNVSRITEKRPARVRVFVSPGYRPQRLWDSAMGMAALA